MTLKIICKNKPKDLKKIKHHEKIHRKCFKKNQTELLELKNISRMKNFHYRCNIQWELQKKRSVNLNTAIETMIVEAQREKKTENEPNISDLWAEIYWQILTNTFMEKKAPICSIGQFSWCKYSHRGWFQGANVTSMNTTFSKLD